MKRIKQSLALLALLSAWLIISSAGYAYAQQTESWINCTGTNDTPAFLAAIAGAGGRSRTIKIPYKADLSKRCRVTGIVIPENITIDNTDGSGITASGVDLVINGPIINPPGKQFFFPLSGATLTLGGSVSAHAGQTRVADGQGGESYQTRLPPVPPNDPTQFLNGQNQWVVPPGGGGTPGGLNTQLQFNNNGAFGATSGGTATATQVTLNSPIIANVKDANGASILDLTPIVSAVNFLRIRNASAASPVVSLNAAGTSSDVSLRLLPLGNGNVQLNGTVSFGGITSLSPALRPDTTDTTFLAARLGDNSGQTGMSASIFRTGGSQLTTFRGVDLASTHGVFFKSGTDPLVADYDVELYRESPGVLAVGDGTLNPLHYRDLKMRSLTLQSPAGNVVTLKAPDTGTPSYTLPSGFVAGQYMKVDALGNLSFGTPAGSGDVVGPGSATNSALTCFDGTSGKLLKECGLTLSGTNTGDQNIFGSVVVSGQTTVTANATNTALTFVAGSNMTITTDNTAKSVTFAASAGGGGGLPDPGGNGFVSRNALNTDVARTLTGTTNQVSITNGDGVSGNPVFSIPTAAQLNIAKITNLTAGLVKSDGSGTLSVDTSTYLTANQTITITNDVTGSGTTSITATIGANKVLDSMIRQGVARSVIGHAGSSTGNVADITATNASDSVLRESGGSVGFGTIATAAYANSSITYAKIQNVTASRLLCRGDSGTGPPQECVLGGGLSMSGATLSAAASVPAQTGLLGTVKLSATPTDAANPVVVVTEDGRVNVKRAIQEFPDFATALSTIGSTPTTLVINTTTTSGNATVPSTLKLEFTQAGKLSVNSGTVVTMQTGKVDADLRQQIFAASNTNTGAAGTGQVRFTTEYPREFSPTWWGAKADSTISSTTTDNLPFFKAVLASMQAGIPSNPTYRHIFQGGVIHIPGANACYGLSGTWEIYRPVTIVGDGPAVGGEAQQGSLLCVAAGATGIFVHRQNTSDTYTSTDASGTKITGLGLIGKTASADGTANVSVGTLVMTRASGSVDFTSNFGGAHTVTLNGYVYVVQSVDSSTQVTLRKPRLLLNVTNGSASVGNAASEAWPSGNWNGRTITIAGKNYTISTNSTTTMTLSATFAEASNSALDAEVQSLAAISGANFTLNRFHGIDSKAEVEISNVIVQSFSGNGVSIDTSLSPPLSDTFSGTITTNGTTTVTASSAVFKPEFIARTFTLSGGGSSTGTITDVGCATQGCTSTTATLNVAPGWSTSGNTLIVGTATLMNADSSRLDRVDALLNKGHGIFLHGIDSNQMTIANVNAAQNLGAGILEESFLGNAYIGPHTRDNGYGAFYTSTDSSANESTIQMFYAEGGQPSPSCAQFESIFGAVLGTGVMAKGSLCTVTVADKAWLKTTGLRWIQPKGNSVPGTPGVTLGSYLGDRDPASLVFSSMAVAEDTASSSPQGGATDTPLPVYNWAYNHYGTGWFSLYYNDAAGSTNKDLIAVSGSQASAGSDLLRFPNGFTVVGGSKVGIGTASPQKPLHVVATSYANGIAVGKDDANNLLLMGYDTTNNVGAIGSFASGVGSTLTINRDGGNVGIGTASPQSKLQVNGQLTVDPLGTYNLVGFPVNHYAVNITGDINPVKDCAQNGVAGGLSVFLRLNGAATNCGDTLTRSAILVSMDSGNDRQTEAAVNIAYQDFPTITNGASALTIVSATNTNPVEFTLSAPVVNGYPYNWTTGASWLIEGATNNWTPVNGWFRITVTAANKFTINVNSSSFGSLTGSLKTCYICSKRENGLNGTIEWVGTTDNPNIADPLGSPTAPNGRSVTETIFTGGSHQATAALAIANFEAFNTAPFTSDNTHWPQAGIYVAEVAVNGLWFHKRAVEDLSDPFSNAMILADAPTANIIKGQSGRTITNGVDISAMTVTGNAYASPSFSVSGAGNLLAKSVRGTAVTFSNVPGSPVEGMLVAITDSTTATWGATITGGGSNHVLGYFNGVNWTVAAK